MGPDPYFPGASSIKGASHAAARAKRSGCRNSRLHAPQPDLLNPTIPIMAGLGVLPTQQLQHVVQQVGLLSDRRISGMVGIPRQLVEGRHHADEAVGIVQIGLLDLRESIPPACSAARFDGEHEQDAAPLLPWQAVGQQDEDLCLSGLIL
jgi:hypothetical protein